MSSKWYVGVTVGEGDSTFVANLTDDEAKAVVKFLDCQETGRVYDAYGGECGILFPGYDTREEAINAARKWDGVNR